MKTVNVKLKGLMEGSAKLEKAADYANEHNVIKMYLERSKFVQLPNFVDMIAVFATDDDAEAYMEKNRLNRNLGAQGQAKKVFDNVNEV